MPKSLAAKRFPKILVDSSRIIDFNRLIIAISVFGFLELLEHVKNIDTIRTLTIIYVVLASVTLFLNLFSWKRRFRYRFLVLIFDAAILLLFLAIHYNRPEDVFPITSILLAHNFVNLSASWRSRTLFLVALGILTGILVLIALLGIVGIIHFGIEMASFIVLLSISGISLWIGLQIGRIQIPRLIDEDYDQASSLTRTMLLYTRQVSGATTVALCWIDEATSECYAQFATKDDVTEPFLLESFSASKSLRCLSPMIFNVPDRICLKERQSDRSKGLEDLDPLLCGLLPELDCSVGFGIPIQPSKQTTYWLIASGITMLGVGHLAFAKAIASELSICVKWHSAAAAAKSGALRDLRDNVASDLHDSVAHSLAGAKYMLTALRSKAASGANISAQIESVSSALHLEYEHVRRLITDLRFQEHSTSQVDVLAQARSDIALLQTRWRVALEIVDSDFRVLLPSSMAFQLRQLVREAVANGVQHGSSTQFKLSMRKRSREELLVVISNNSDNQSIDQKMDFFPSSIGERASKLGGTLEVESSVGWTLIKVSIPCPS